MISKEKAYRVEVKYYDKEEERNEIKFLFCVSEETDAEVEILNFAYQRFCDVQPDISKYSIVKYDFNKDKTDKMSCIGQRLSLIAFNYTEVYS